MSAIEVAGVVAGYLAAGVAFMAVVVRYDSFGEEEDLPLSALVSLWPILLFMLASCGVWILAVRVFRVTAAAVDRPLFAIARAAQRKPTPALPTAKVVER